MRRVEQPPPPSHEWWTPTWWFLSQTSRTPFENGMADAYTDVHYRAIRFVVSTGIAGMFCITAGLISHSLSRGFTGFTGIAAFAMSLLF